MKYVMRTLGFYQLIKFLLLMVRYLEYSVFFGMREIFTLHSIVDTMNGIFPCVQWLFLQCLEF